MEPRDAYQCSPVSVRHSGYQPQQHRQPEWREEETQGNTVDRPFGLLSATASTFTPALKAPRSTGHPLEPTASSEAQQSCRSPARGDKLPPSVVRTCRSATVRGPDMPERHG
jgi:hypothetical protein